MKTTTSTSTLKNPERQGRMRFQLEERGQGERDGRRCGATKKKAFISVGQKKNGALRRKAEKKAISRGRLLP